MRIGVSADNTECCIVLATITGLCGKSDVKPVHLLFCCVCTSDMAASWVRLAQVMDSIIAMYVMYTAAA